MKVKFYNPWKFHSKTYVYSRLVYISRFIHDNTKFKIHNVKKIILLIEFSLIENDLKA